MIRPRPTRPAARSSAGLLVLALLVAGCMGSGGGGSSAGRQTLTRSQYVNAAGIICRRYQQRINGLKPTTDLARLAAQGARAVALERAELRELRRLAPPSEDAPAIDRMLAAADAGVAAAEALVSAARSGNTAAVASAAVTLQSRLAEANRLAKPLGLDVCAA